MKNGICLTASCKRLRIVSSTSYWWAVTKRTATTLLASQLTQSQTSKLLKAWSGTSKLLRNLHLACTIFLATTTLKFRYSQMPLSLESTRWICISKLQESCRVFRYVGWAAASILCCRKTETRVGRKYTTPTLGNQMASIKLLLRKSGSLGRTLVIRLYWWRMMVLLIPQLARTRVNRVSKDTVHNSRDKLSWKMTIPCWSMSMAIVMTVTSIQNWKKKQILS